MDVVVGVESVAGTGNAGRIGIIREPSRYRCPRESKDRTRYARFHIRREIDRTLLFRKPIRCSVSGAATEPCSGTDQYRRCPLLGPQRHRFHWLGSGHCVHGPTWGWKYSYAAAREAVVHRAIRAHQLARAGLSPKTERMDHCCSTRTVLHQGRNRCALFESL